MPGHQSDLVTSVTSVAGKPIVLVLMGGGPVDVKFADVDSRIASIVWIGYPGEGGKALAEVIFGDHNPGGRLPITWYPESFTSIPMSDMNMRADPCRAYPGRTYRFYTGERIYGFGHGLSYTDFTYKLLSAPNELSISESQEEVMGSSVLKASALQGLEMSDVQPSLCFQVVCFQICSCR